MLFVSIWEIEIEHQVLKSDKFIAGTKCIAFILPAFQTILITLPPVKSIPILDMAIEIGVSKSCHPASGLYGVHPLI